MKSAAPPPRPVGRLVVLALLVLVGLVAGLDRLASPPIGTPDSDPLVASDDDVTGVRQCSRGGRGERRGADPVVVDEIRDAVGPDTRVTSAAVVACPAAFDRLPVRYVGEVVGDVLHRDGGAWVLVNDDAYALEVGPLSAHGVRRGTNSGLTVWLPAELASQVTPGRPGLRGDVVDLRATVVREDAAEGGGLTLRATSAEVVRRSSEITTPLRVAQLVVAILASSTVVVLWWLRRRAVARFRRRAA